MLTGYYKVGYLVVVPGSSKILHLVTINQRAEPKKIAQRIHQIAHRHRKKIIDDNKVSKANMVHIILI